MIVFIIIAFRLHHHRNAVTALSTVANSIIPNGLVIDNVYTTQQLATAFNISTRAVTKWIKGLSNGDTFTMRGYEWKVINKTKPVKLSPITLIR